MASSLETFCQRVRADLLQATFVQKRQQIELLIDRVIVTDEQVEIRYMLSTSPHGQQTRFSHLHTDYCLQISVAHFIGDIPSDAQKNNLLIKVTTVKQIYGSVPELSHWIGISLHLSSCTRTTFCARGHIGMKSSRSLNGGSST